MQNRFKQFRRAQEKGEKLLKKRKPARLPTEKGWVELVPHLQKSLCELDNPYVNGLEGFFILESSIDGDPTEILRLYKERDKAEKFIRALKEGVELRPIRHWNKYSILGALFVAFIANTLINLTAYTRKKPLDGKTPNVKLLKKNTSII